MFGPIIRSELIDTHHFVKLVYGTGLAREFRVCELGFYFFGFEDFVERVEMSCRAMDEEEFGFGFEDGGEALEGCLGEDMFAEGGGGEAWRGEENDFKVVEVKVP